jgi:phospholipase C
MAITRRRFLAGVAGTAGALATGAALRSPAGRVLGSTGRLPSPGSSGVDHIVVLCMENRSFDHMLGWVPDADGAQQGLSYRHAATGAMHATHHLAPDWQGCALQDPDHSYDGGRAQLNLGACDGFLGSYVDVGKSTVQFDDLAIGYYTGDDLPVSRALADNFTVFDRWFCSLLGPTYPNRIYTHAAATDRISNTSATSTLPTIWDRLQTAGVTCGYYFSDLPLLALWGTKYVPISNDIGTFLAQASSGNLPQFSYVDPNFGGEGQGTSNDDHPHADVRRGQALISLLVNTLMHGPAWSKTVFIITYDEWGGFYDHMRPPRFPDAVTHQPNSVDTVTGFEDHTQAGFRVPAYVVSPFAPRGHVSHRVLDHTAIPRFVEWRFGLESLSVRDAASANLAEVLDFSAPNLVAPAVPTVVDPGPHVCGTPDLPAGSMGASMAAEDTFWHELAATPQMAAFRARRNG